MSIRHLMVISTLLLAACQATQLSGTTTNGASAVEPIYRQQALDNLAKLIREPFSLPSQISIQNGTMQVNETVTPTVTFPFSSTFAKTISSTPSSSNTVAGGGGSLAGTLGYQLNYVIQPATDIVGLSNLRAIYMAVICLSKPDLGDCKSFRLLEIYMPPRVYQPKWETDKIRPEKAQLLNQLVLDPYFLYPPLCVLCLTDNAVVQVRDIGLLIDSTDDKSFRDYLTVAFPFVRPWLTWGNAPPVDGAVPLGTSGGFHFYGPPRTFADFLILALPLPVSPTRYVPTFTPLPVPGKPKPRAGGKAAASPPEVPFQFQAIPGSSEPAPQFRSPIPQGILPNPPG